jgi:cytochrome c oxidase subunit IV
MTEHVIPPRTYVTVLVVLLGLTALTLGVSLTPLEGVWHIIIGLVIAVSKASLVVLFFMHALYSPRLTWVVIAAALLWLLILVSLTLSDYFTRGLLPYSGH